MKEVAKYADWLFYLSIVGVILAAYGAFAASDLWLAPTQWLEVSMVIILYALYLKHAE
jgi:hypothetical protein